MTGRAFSFIFFVAEKATKKDAASIPNAKETNLQGFQNLVGFENYLHDQKKTLHVLNKKIPTRSKKTLQEIKP